MRTRPLVPRLATRGTLIVAALVMLGACSSSGSGFNPFDRKSDSSYERDQRQRGQEPRNRSDIEQRKRGGQDSSQVVPLGAPAVTPYA
jgi:hypothetical protein